MGSVQADTLNQDQAGINTSASYGDAGDGIPRWHQFHRVVDGGHVTVGKTTDAAITNPSSNGTLMAFIKGILSRLNGGLPATLSSGGGLRVGVVDALPAGGNNIGDVDVLTLPAIPAGGNLIGDVGLRVRQGNATVKSAGTISASGNSGDIDTSTYDSAVLVVNVTAVTGSPNFDLYWEVKYSGVYYRMTKLTSTPITTTGSVAFPLAKPLGPTGRVAWVLNSGTSWNMTADLLMES